MSTTEAAPAPPRPAGSAIWARGVDDLAPAYDHVVVGAGSAGCVLARRLAERGRRVLLLEAGPTDTGREDVADAARWTALLRGDLDWGLDYAPTPEVLGRTIGLPRGRVLGGSSSTNAMLWYRGHPSDYDGWAAGGAPGWGFEQCLPAFRRSEDFEDGGSHLRGTGGPLRLERPRDPHPAALALLEAAAERGHRILPDGVGARGDAADLAGASLAVLNASAGRRWSTVSGYLRDPSVDLSTLTVLTGSTAVRLRWDGTRATGVEHVFDGALHTTSAHGDVLLSAGAVESPRLLMASGVGDPSELDRLGVDLRLALPGLGRNLQDHPLVEGVNLRARAPIGRVRDNGGGALLNWRSSTAPGPAPDLHAFVVQGVSATAEVASRFGLDRAAGDVVGVGFGLMGSRSRGWMRVHDLTPGGAVELQPRFLAEHEDLDALVEGLTEVLELTGGAAFTALAPQRLAPAPGSGRPRLTREEAEEFVRLACSTFFHTCGTAAMGTGEGCVVDPELRVHGAQGLRVIDASVFPTIPTCNTQAPVVMVAERAAELVAA